MTDQVSSSPSNQLPFPLASPATFRFINTSTVISSLLFCFASLSSGIYSSIYSSSYTYIVINLNYTPPLLQHRAPNSFPALITERTTHHNGNSSIRIFISFSQHILIFPFHSIAQTSSIQTPWKAYSAVPCATELVDLMNTTDAIPWPCFLAQNERMSTTEAKSSCRPVL